MADPKSVWNEVMEFLSTMQLPTAVEDRESIPVERGRTDFGVTHGPATGKVQQPSVWDRLEGTRSTYIPGTMDGMAQQMGLASDDPYQIAAKLEAWKRQRGRK